MKKFLKNYTSDVPVSQTIDDIEARLHDTRKRNVALRALVDKWRNDKYSTAEKIYLRQCARELEALL